MSEEKPHRNVINEEDRKRELNRERQARWRERNRDVANERSRDAMRRLRGGE